MRFSALIALLAGSLICPEPEERLDRFWDSLLAGDLKGAAEMVQPEASAWFLEGWKLRVSSWAVQEWRSTSPESAVAVIRATVESPQARVPLRIEQKWLRVGSDWYVDLPSDPSSRTINQSLLGPSREPVVRGEKPSTVPQELVLHYLNPVQRGAFSVHNDLGSNMEIGSCEFDRERFRLEPQSLRVEPGDSGRLIVEYIGADEEKELVEGLDCVLSQEGRVEALRLTIRYNHVSPEAKAFFGLDDVAVSKLSREDLPAPVLRPPQ